MRPLDGHKRPLLGRGGVHVLGDDVVPRRRAAGGRRGGRSGGVLRVDVQRDREVLVVVGERRGVASVAVQPVTSRGAHVPALDGSQLGQQAALVRHSLFTQLHLFALLQLLLLLLQPRQVAMRVPATKRNRLASFPN